MNYKFRQKFTLIELLVVIAIIVIIFSISLPAFLKMTKGQSVEIAARTIGSKLNAVRAYAITNREYTALVFITNNEAISSRYKFRSYRPCIVDGSNVFQSWVPDEKWDYLPNGTVLRGIQASSVSHPTKFSKNFESNIYTDITAPTSKVILSTNPPLKGIIFKPTGDCEGSRKIIIVGNGNYTYAADDTTPPNTPAPNPQFNFTPKETDNYINITVDNYTGRVSYGSD
ncbi:MAG TPA: prepilin-type N-terminal cleavage/methylation domain-containing protein [Victivallales bacterium]|nr:prepilin-type N-terminal cleavage/methylation domain-containing protein [Victivallales bacterium]